MNFSSFLFSVIVTIISGIIVNVITLAIEYKYFQNSKDQSKNPSTLHQDKLPTSQGNIQTNNFNLGNIYSLNQKREIAKARAEVVGHKRMVVADFLIEEGLMKGFFKR